ncbi:hypothetical protein LPJ54_006956, partial [Coemansia sp. RSA 1824]
WDDNPHTRSVRRSIRHNWVPVTFRRPTTIAAHRLSSKATTRRLRGTAVVPQHRYPCSSRRPSPATGTIKRRPHHMASYANRRTVSN